MTNQLHKPLPTVLGIGVAVGVVLLFWRAGHMPLGLVVAGVALLLFWRYVFGTHPIMTSWSDMSGLQKVLFALIVLCMLGGAALLLVGGT